MIELLAILRFIAFTVVFIHFTRMLSSIRHSKGSFRVRLFQHFARYPQDTAIVLFLPIYLYMTLFSVPHFIEQLIGLPLAIYIGAPLVKEVFFSKEQKITTVIKPVTNN